MRSAGVLGASGPTSFTASTTVSGLPVRAAQTTTVTAIQPAGSAAVRTTSATAAGNHDPVLQAGPALAYVAATSATAATVSAGVGRGAVSAAVPSSGRAISAGPLTANINVQRLPGLNREGRSCTSALPAGSLLTGSSTGSSG